MSWNWKKRIASSREQIRRPVTEHGKPTEIRVVGAVHDVDKINSAEQNFTLNFYALFRWMDPSLAHAGPGSDIRGGSVKLTKPTYF
ncbi:MAG: hypothetical protein HKP12_12430 [Gammaproteobacteria bacterium]|nr:hypothetical protein [Gammaproteobacteria bacterium]NNJ97952.1 hypothetical protein [Gammaproteobacteria bacterium]